MSDRNRIILEDKGWNRMSAILDRELPEKKKRRPFVWVFLSGVFMLVFAMLILDKDTDSKEHTNELIAQSVKNIHSQEDELEYQKKTKDSFSNINTVNTSKSNDSENRLNNKSYSSKPEISSISKIEINTNDKISESDLSGSSNLTDNKNSLVHKEKIEEVLDEANNSQSTIAPDYVFEAKEKINTVENKSILPTENLKGKNVNFRNILQYSNLPHTITNVISTNVKKYDNLNFKMVDQNSIVKPKKINKPSNNYLFVASQLGTNPNGIGFSVGIGREFKANRFNVFIEGGYAKMNFSNTNSVSNPVIVDIVEDGNSSVSESELTEINSNAIKEALAQNQFSNISLINNIKSIFISTGINKDISRKLGFSMGLTYSRLLKIENDEINYSSNNGLLQQDLDGYNVSKSAFFDNGEYRKFELASRFGVRYQIIPRLAISGSYTLGLTDIINRANLDTASNTALDPVGPTGEIQTSRGTSLYRRNAELRLDFRF